MGINGVEHKDILSNERRLRKKSILRKDQAQTCGEGEKLGTRSKGKCRCQNETTNRYSGCAKLEERVSYRRR